MVLTLSFCIVKVTDAIAFKFMLPIYPLIQVKIVGCKFKIFAMFPICFGNENDASLQTGR